MRIAVLITVFNRRDITIKGLRGLCSAIRVMPKDYIFDIYLTDDGSTDGTGDEIKKNYPDVNVIKGSGNLYWGGGMRLAWQSAVNSGIDYDYYLWYNDDSELYENALITMFESISPKSIVTGAFCNHQNIPSYGGRDQKNQIIEPKGIPHEIYLMNGNLVLIPKYVFEVVGSITPRLKHGGGDFDYGFRARKAGFKVVLSNKYVGISERHDEFIPKYCSPDLNFIKRWRILHSPVYSPMEHFKYGWEYNGTISAVISFIICYAGVFSPFLYKKIKESFLK